MRFTVNLIDTVYSALNNNVRLKGKVIPVFVNKPSDNIEGTYIWLSNSLSVDNDTMTTEGEEIDLTIDVYSPIKNDMLSVGKIVKGLVHNQSLTNRDATIVSILYQRFLEIPVPDNNKKFYHGVAIFKSVIYEKVMDANQ